MPIGPTRVVILGGGFAGISTALQLGRWTKRTDSIEAHLICNENYFVFQPLLPEVVSCSIEPGHILNPIRHLCPLVHFHWGTVKEMNLSRREVIVIGRDERKVTTLEYDQLVFSLGNCVDLHTIPGMADHSLPIKTLGDAFHLRNHILSRLEEADIEVEAPLQQKALTFVVVGGGFSGVETAGAINDMVKNALRFYPQARERGVRVILVHSGQRILHELGEPVAEFAGKKIQERGVELLLRNRVTEATADGIVLSDGRAISAGTVVCTVGNVGHPLVTRSDLPQNQGRILVDMYLRVQGSDALWGIGDTALIPDGRGGFCPPTAQYAMREGRLCANNILATIHGRRPRPFTFRGFGQLAAIGRHCGVARILKWNTAGILAWYLWRCVYLAKIPGLRCKLRVGIDWLLEALLPPDITMMDVQRTGQLRRAHYRPGDVIIKQGEIAQHFFIIESGEVEILREEPGHGETLLGTRCAGASFGEIALLKSVPRTATVRCLSPVDVVMFSRQDFLSLMNTHKQIRALVEKDVNAVMDRKLS